MTMQVVVTGANGFIGQHLVPRLLASGHRVTATSRGGGAPAGARHLALGSEGSEAAWRAALAGADAVIHLAGRAHRVAEAPDAAAEQAHMAVNRDWTLRLARAAREAGVARFLFASTIGVHGVAGAQPVTEASPLMPHTPYAASKLEAEQGLLLLFAGEGCSLVVLRPPLVAGAGAPGNLARLLRLAGSPLPLPLGAVANRRTLLSVDGLCEAVLAVLRRWGEAPASGSYVLGDATPISTRDIVAALREGLGRKPRLLPVPVPLLAAMLRAAGREGIAAQLLGDLVVEPAAFARDFGWEPVADTRVALRAMAQAGRAQPSPKPHPAGP